jgi:hypothetical protein
MQRVAQQGDGADRLERRYLSRPSLRRRLIANALGSTGRVTIAKRVKERKHGAIEQSVGSDACQRISSVGSR